MGGGGGVGMSRFIFADRDNGDTCAWFPPLCIHVPVTLSGREINFVSPRWKFRKARRVRRTIRFIKETLLSLSLQSVFFTDIPLPRGKGASWRRAVPINELRTLEFFVCWWERIGEIFAIIGLIMVKMVRLNQKRLQLCNEMEPFLKSLLYY